MDGNDEFLRQRHDVERVLMTVLTEECPTSSQGDRQRAAWRIAVLFMTCLEATLRQLGMPD